MDGRNKEEAVKEQDQQKNQRGLNSICLPEYSLTAVHVFQRLLRLLGCLKLNVGVALRQVRVNTVQGHVNHLDLAVVGKDLLDVFLERKRTEMV